MTTDLTELARRLPTGLRAREPDDADVERIVEFQNRFAPPAGWTTPAEMRHMEAAAPEPHRRRILVEDGAGAVAALGRTSDGGIFRSPDGSWSLGLRVDPTWRRRGVGTLVLERLEEHARGKGATRVVASVRGNEPEGAAFAKARGYSPFHERIDAYIDVPQFDASAFPDPDETARQAGIRLATYGEVLAEHAPDVETFQRRMLPAIWEMARDVPSPTPPPESPPPFEQVRGMFFEGPGIDPATTIIALRGDAVVGMSVTAVKANGTAYTNFTGVARAERGRGVALAMKLRALRALRSRGVRLFGTTNDEQNAAMRGINRRLGYVPEPPTTIYEKRFT